MANILPTILIGYVILLRVVLARECAAILLKEKENPVTCSFVGRMGTKMAGIIADSFTSSESRSKQREKLWTSFYAFRSSELGKWWKGLVSDLKLSAKFQDQWLIQTACRTAMERLIIVKHPLSSASTSAHKLSLDEHNTLRYCAGYVLLWKPRGALFL